MNAFWQGLALLLLSGVIACSVWQRGEDKTPRSPRSDGPHPQTVATFSLSLPPPRFQGTLSLEEALAKRRSVREFQPDPLSPEQLSQLLWALQGITHPSGLRTAPSAGALYPLEIYLILPEAMLHYNPQGHTLRLWREGDLRPALYAAALRQEALLQAAAVFVLTAVLERTEAKYGRSRSPRYVAMEAGHAAQNFSLQAVALGLGSVPIAAFSDTGVQEALKLPKNHQPLYLLAVGYPPR